jgi:DNA-binding CsgD family transcriptional regulator
LVRAYEVNNRCPEALPYFLEAFRTNKNKHESFEYYQYRQALGECYSCLGRLDSAEFYIRQALESPDTGNLSVAHIMLADIAKKRGDFSAAYQEEAEGLRLFKIKFTSEKAAATAEFEARYESVQKENRISSLEKQSLIERQRFQIGILYLLLAFGLVFMLFIRQRMLHQKTKQSRMLAEQAKELAEARALAHLVDLEDTKADLKTTRQDLEHNKRLLELKNLLVDDLQIRLSLPEQQAADRINTATFKILTDSDWRQFRQQFERKFPGFQDNLNGRYPALTSSESRLFLLIKLGFSTKEIADILGIAQESVWRNRHRLASKLELGNTNDLESFVERFNQGSAEEERDGVTA